MIKISRLKMTGYGGYETVEAWINKNEISTITKQYIYPYCDSYFIKMNNGESFYAHLKEEDL